MKKEIMRKQDKAGRVFRLIKTHPIWHLFQIEYLEAEVWKPARNKIMLQAEALATFNAIIND